MAFLLTALPVPQWCRAQVSYIGTKKITAKPFKTGLQTGFWEVNNAQQLTLDSIGKRPTSRVGFSSWNDFELPDGSYNFATAGNAYARAHNYGETVFGAINMCFSDSVTQKNVIPSQYVRDISNPATEAAGLRFIKSYVGHILNTVGAITLTIDYEICSNYRLSSTGTDYDKWHHSRNRRADDWGKWYVKAARAARDTAIAMGKGNLLKLMPIVNGNVIDPGNAINAGPVANPWLAKVVDSSDYLAFDTYQSDPSTPLSSPKTTLDIIQFWIDSFSRTKDVIVTENGYNVAPSYISGVTRASRGDKLTGSIAQQDTFYRQLFDSLIVKSKPGGSFKGKLRSYNIWAICDNPAKSPTDGDYYFGIIGLNPTTGQPYSRPALAAVRDGYNRIDTNTVLRPYDDSVFVNSLPTITPANPVSLTYSNGDYFDYLRYRAKFGNISNSYYLHVKTQDTGNLMIHVNDKWLYFAQVKAQDIDLKNCGATIYYGSTANNIIDVYCTSAKFPFTQNVTQLFVDGLTTAPRGVPAGIAATALTDLQLYPNPAHTAITVKGMDATRAFTAEVFNNMGQLVKRVHTTTIPVAELADGLYQLRVTQDGKVSTLPFVKE